LATLDILLVWFTIVWIMITIWPYYRWVALAQLPYLVWVSIATTVQVSIWWGN
jgi:tryptophan-rich sensory protein